MDSNFMGNLANAMKNGNIPDDIKNIMNNMKNATSNANNTNNNFDNNDNFNTSNDNMSNTSNSINPDMLKNIMNMFNNSNNNTNNDSNNNFFGDSSSSNDSNSGNSSNSMPNFDINMLLKMKSIMDKMNSSKNDPRSNLLLSLKPYLKESRKNKVEQYVQLFNMTKVIDAFNQDNGGENSK